MMMILAIIISLASVAVTTLIGVAIAHGELQFFIAVYPCLMLAFVSGQACGMHHQERNDG